MILLVKYIIIPLFILFFLYVVISIVLFSHAKISFYQQDSYIVNIGYIGSFLSGATSLFTLILTIYAAYYIRKTYLKDKSREFKDSFESKFFSLINNILSIKESIDKDKLSSILNDVRNMNLYDAKVFIRNENSVYGDFFRNFYLILKFIDKYERDINNDILDKKFYTNLLRSYLTVDLLQLLTINCFILEDEVEANYNIFKMYIEKYSILEHVPFIDAKREIFFPALCSFNYYDKNAFDKNIWFNRNISIGGLYNANSKNMCTPFLDFILNKRINSECLLDSLYVKHDGDIYEFNFKSKKFNDYESFVIAASSSMGLMFDDHLSANIRLECDSKLYGFYLRLYYSKDFVDVNLNYSEILIDIFESNNIFCIRVEPPKYILIE